MYTCRKATIDIYLGNLVFRKATFTHNRTFVVLQVLLHSHFPTLEREAQTEFKCVACKITLDKRDLVYIHTTHGTRVISPVIQLTSRLGWEKRGTPISTSIFLGKLIPAFDKLTPLLFFQYLLLLIWLPVLPMRWHHSSDRDCCGAPSGLNPMQLWNLTSLQKLFLLPPLRTLGDMRCDAGWGN